MRIQRRILAFLLVLAVPLLPLTSAPRPNGAAQKSDYLVFVGTYTTKTTSKGIYAFRFDTQTGKLTPIGVAAETPDPSFVVIHPNGKYLYAVNESGKSSSVSAFALDAQSGKLTLLNQLPALGEDPCYISLDRTGKYVFVANYTSGNIVVFPILPDGKLGEHTALMQNAGTLGPNKERQEAPHAHWIEATGMDRYVTVADLGLDRILVYKFDATRGTLAPDTPAAPVLKRGDVSIARPFSAELPPGSGPRHLAISSKGNFAYVLGEIQSTVTVYARDAVRDSYRRVQVISALPEGFSGRNDAAEIAMHPNGKFLFTSNRGNDTIAVFSIHPGDGQLTLLANVPTAGKEPRHFAIDPSGNYLLSEDQWSDSIVEFRIDTATGNLTPTGETVSVPSPVCLKFLATN